MVEPSNIPVRGLMRAKPGHCVAADRTPGMTVTVYDVSNCFAAPITLSWIGKEAIEFYEQNKADLIPGRCLDLELVGFRPGRNDELRATVVTCQMAPLAPSWIKHAEKMNSAKPANPPTPGLRIV